MKKECPSCKETKRFYQLKDGRVKCASCKKYFTRNKDKMIISKKLLKRIISEFVLEHSTNTILERIDISKYRLMKVLTTIRQAMNQDIPETFKGTVEVDETYLGGQWKNKRLKVKRDAKIEGCASKKGRGTKKQPVFGILCRSGKVWAEIVDNVEGVDLLPIIEKRVAKGSTVCSDTWRAYTGIAYRGYVHRMVNHSQNEYSDLKGTHINGLEGFWGYLKRKLSAKGGIRRSRLGLYLGEYVWRYNHKNVNLKQRENIVYATVYSYFRCV